jgi:hypothetical protein
MQEVRSSSLRLPTIIKPPVFRGFFVFNPIFIGLINIFCVKYPMKVSFGSKPQQAGMNSNKP